MSFACFVVLSHAHVARIDIVALSGRRAGALRRARRRRGTDRGAGAARASSAINLASTDLTKGYDYNALIQASPDGLNAYDPRYGANDLFQPGAQGQFSVKFIF